MDLVSPRQRRDLLAGTLAAAVSLAGFAAYWVTHGASPHWQDSGLFISALQAGGGLLSPGYPVYLAAYWDRTRFGGRVARARKDRAAKASSPPDLQLGEEAAA